jgi:hypothetical protein
MSTREETRKVPSAAVADRPQDAAGPALRPPPAPNIWERLIREVVAEIEQYGGPAGPRPAEQQHVYYYADPFKVPPWVLNPPRLWPIRWDKPQPVPWSPAELIAARHPALYDVIHPHGPAFAALLARAVIARVAALVDIGAGLGEPGQRESSQLGGGYLSRFIDDWCGTPPRFKIPRPRPPWLDEELSTHDLLVIGAEFSAAAGAADGVLGLLLDKAVLDLRQGINARL